MTPAQYEELKKELASMQQSLDSIETKLKAEFNPEVFKAKLLAALEPELRALFERAKASL